MQSFHPIAYLLISAFLFPAAAILLRFSYLKESVGNDALMLRLGGFIAAVAIAQSGVAAGVGDMSFFGMVSYLLINGLIATGLLVGALWVNDKFILTGVDNTVAVKGGNIAVAIVEAGGLIGSGLILRWALTGEGGSIWAAIVFFVLGQVMMVAMMFAHARAEEFFKDSSLVKQVESGNVAASVLAAGKLLAYSLIMAGAAATTFKGWGPSLETFFIVSIGGMVFLYLVEIMINFCVSKWTQVKNVIDSQNVPAATFFAIAKFGVAWPVATVASSLPALFG